MFATAPLLRYIVLQFRVEHPHYTCSRVKYSISSLQKHMIIVDFLLWHNYVYSYGHELVDMFLLALFVIFMSV